MAKINIKDCKVSEINMCEIDLTDIIYRIVLNEVKNNFENKKIS